MLRSPRVRLASCVLATGALFLATACGSADDADAGATDTGMAAMTPMAGPDTTAAAVWDHLTAQNYAATWPMWPGKGALYTGGDPHGMLLTTYVNTVASGALASGATMMPAGAIIVKENYMPDSTLAAVTVMYKASGYDPANNDWFWIKRLADGTVEASGRVAGCQTCHAQAAADYILTAPLGGAGM